MILDGFGLNDKKDANAVYEAKTPVIDDFCNLSICQRAMPADCRWFQEGQMGQL